MLTLLVTANRKVFDVSKAHEELVKSVSKLEKKFEVVLLAKTDSKNLKQLKQITVSAPSHYLLVGDANTTDDEMVQLGMEFAEGNDVLICTLDTKPEVLTKVLEKKSSDRQIIWVRRKIGKFKNFFRNIGICAYNFGLKLLGKNSDNLNEVRIGYFDGRVAKSISENVRACRELRITNSFKQLKSGTVEEKELYYDEHKKTSKENNMLGLGTVSFIYIIALLALLVVYPCFNNMTYSWWMVVAIIAWVLFGVLSILGISKKIFKSRCGSIGRADDFGERIYGAVEIVKSGDELKSCTKISEINIPIIKNKIIIKKDKPKTTFKKQSEKKTETKIKTESKRTNKTKTAKTKIVASKTEKSKGE